MVVSVDFAGLCSPFEDAPGSREADGTVDAEVPSVPSITALLFMVFSSSPVVTLAGAFSLRVPLAGSSVLMNVTRGEE